jgi:hypothetical protein
MKYILVGKGNLIKNVMGRAGFVGPSTTSCVGRFGSSLSQLILKIFLPNAAPAP